MVCHSPSDWIRLPTLLIRKITIGGDRVPAFKHNLISLASRRVGRSSSRTAVTSTSAGLTRKSPSITEPECALETWMLRSVILTAFGAVIPKRLRHAATSVSIAPLSRSAVHIGSMAKMSSLFPEVSPVSRINWRTRVATSSIPSGSMSGPIPPSERTYFSIRS